MSGPRKDGEGGGRMKLWLAILGAALLGAIVLGQGGRQNLVIEREARRACGGAENVAEITATGFRCRGVQEEN